MANFKNIVEKCVWKVARNLIRDYSELELLNSGSKTTENFVLRSCIRAKDVFLQEFESLKFTSIQFSDSYKPIEGNGIHILICPIGSVQNLQRAFPFFASTILQIKQENNEETIIAALISFPALGQIFYAEKGQGAWMEKYEDSGIAKGRRLRVSSVKNIADYVTSSKFAAVHNNVVSSRDFGSIEYDIAAFASGKLDAIMVESSDKIQKLAAEIFTKESGGVFKVLENQDLIATNNLIPFPIFK